MRGREFRAGVERFPSRFWTSLLYKASGTGVGSLYRAFRIGRSSTTHSRIAVGLHSSSQFLRVRIGLILVVYHDMAASIPQESFLTPRPISATAIYDALARFSTYESKRLPVPHSTRSAAVTIILRFAHEGVALDLSMLYTERGLTDNANLIHAGAFTFRFESPTCLPRRSNFCSRTLRCQSKSRFRPCQLESIARFVE